MLPSIEELPTLKEGFLPIVRRPRRNRSKESVRDLVEETSLSAKHFVYPLFVTEEDTVQPIVSMPGISRYPLESVFREIEESISYGVRSFLLFFHIDALKKDAFGSEAFSRTGTLFTAITEIKRRFPEAFLMADIALDPFTSHGFDGLLDDEGRVLNDPTVVALCHMALVAAEAGVDTVAPSDMMDGRVSYIRSVLDSHGFSHVGILSYAVKFASSLYSPFRDALSSAPKKGDKKGFQVNPANGREALFECMLDDQEAADMLLVKPGIFSLDIIATVRARTLLPVGAYQVSGEYSMIKAAAQNGWLNEEAVFLESFISMRRAGADFIVTYAAKDAARAMQ